MPGASTVPRAQRVPSIALSSACVAVYERPSFSRVYLRESSQTLFLHTATVNPVESARVRETLTTAYSRHASWHSTSTRSSFCKSIPAHVSSSVSVPSMFRVRTADATDGISPT